MRQKAWLPKAWFSLTLFAFVCCGCVALRAYDEPNAKVAAVDAAIGPCSVEFTVKDAKGAPVYDAKIRVHIAHGFVGMRKLDLEVGTNSDGKGRFDGLPDKVKQPLSLRASQADREGSASYNPSKDCSAEHATIVLDNHSKAPE